MVLVLFGPIDVLISGEPVRGTVPPDAYESGELAGAFDGAGAIESEFPELIAEAHAR